MPIRRVLLVPGLLEPRFVLRPMRRVLDRRFARAEIWRDRRVFRNLDRSISRMRDVIAGDEAKDLAIVTHSFGDWVVRQAIARCDRHRIAALVSITPAMRTGILSRAGYLASWKLTPELTVINDPERAALNLDCDVDLQRLVLWARFDGCLSYVPLPRSPRTRIQWVRASHLSIVLQPSVIHRVADFIATATTDP